MLWEAEHTQTDRLCVCVWVREKVGGRERQTERMRERERERQRERRERFFHSIFIRSFILSCGGLRLVGRLRLRLRWLLLLFQVFCSCYNC